MKSEKIKKMKRIQKGPGFELMSPTGRRITAEVIAKTRIEGKRVLIIRVDL